MKSSYDRIAILVMILTTLIAIAGLLFMYDRIGASDNCIDRLYDGVYTPCKCECIDEDGNHSRRCDCSNVCGCMK